MLINSGRSSLRLVTLAYFLFLNWQLLTPVTLVQAGSWDKLIHFGAFFVLAVLMSLSWRRFSLTQLLVGLISYAALTEVLQHFIPGRSFSVTDWLADGLGVIAALTLAAVLLARWSTVEIRTH